MSTRVTKLFRRPSLAPIFPHALAQAPPLTELQERCCEALTVHGVQLALKRLPLPALCMQAARRREPHRRTLALPAKVDYHDGQALMIHFFPPTKMHFFPTIDFLPTFSQ